MKVARKAGTHGLSLATGMPLPETVKNPGAVARAIMTKGGEGATAENLATLVDGPRKNQLADQGGDARIHVSYQGWWFRTHGPIFVFRFWPAPMRWSTVQVRVWRGLS